MEDLRLKHARALYKDRVRIVLSAMLIVFASTFYFFYSPAIIGIGLTPPSDYPRSSTLGLEVVASYNTIGFLISVLIMAALFRFWSWAFLPSPAITFTFAVLEGILGPKASIKQVLGKRFKVTLENGLQFEVICKTRERGTGDWFNFRLITSPLQGESLHEIALRHGLGIQQNRFVATVSSEELHQRTFLLAKAMMMTQAVPSTS
jgi:hypothetical protein